MPTPMISEQWPRFLLPIVRREWYQMMTAQPSAVEPLFGGGTSSAAVEYSQGIGGGGLVPEYNSDTAEGAPATIQYDAFNPLYETTFTHKEYAKGLAIERKLIDDDQQGLIRRRAQTLGFEYGATIATHRSSVFVNAFSASYVGADGVALCSTAHPNRPNDTGTTFSNKGTAAFSYAAVLTAIEVGAGMLNDRLIPMPITYDTLVIGRANAAKARELFGATGKPGTADNDASALQNMRVLVDPYLGASKDWFLVDSMQSKMHLLWFWRIRPEFALDPSSDFNLVAKYRGYMRYSFGWDDPRFVFGSDVA